MHFSAVVSASAALLGPVNNAGGEACEFGSVLESFESLLPIPTSCLPELNSRATLYCSTFLGIQDTIAYTATVTPEVTRIVLEYETIVISSTDIRTRTTETIDTVLTVVTKLATTTTTTTEFPPPSTTIIPTVTVLADPVTTTVTPSPQVYARRWKLPSCNKIVEGVLAMTHAPSALEEACKCLELRPRTAFLESMADATTVTLTSTGTVADFILESALFTATSVSWKTETSTTTQTITATKTATVDLCGVPYSGSSHPGRGNTVKAGTLATSQGECCVLCQTLKNCVAFAWTHQECQLLIKTSRLNPAPSNAQCPHGIETYDYGTPNSTGVVFRGPCGVPLRH